MNRRPTPRLACALVALFVLGCGDDSSQPDACQPDDFDGKVGGDYEFEVTVTDDGFSPAILTTQNESAVVLTLTNVGAAPHGFVIECLPTPNDEGCATESCFPEEAEIAPLDPGQSAEITFETPVVEGIYRILSSADEATPEAQWVIR